MKIVDPTPGPWMRDKGRPTILKRDGAAIGHFRLVHIDLRLCMANASLAAQAPAQSLALEMIAHKIARIERSSYLIQFCFGGKRYVVEVVSQFEIDGS